MTILDPLHGDGYQFWSGIGGALIAPGLVYLAARMGAFVMPTRCQQIGCRRTAKGVSDAGVPFCARHLSGEG